MTQATIDPRIICNLLLDEAEANGTALTHVPLQKLLYFAHAIFLVQQKRPLVSGHFEAWQYGPVHPAAYRAFKNAGSGPIRFRAVRTNPLTGETTNLAPPSDGELIRHIRKVMLHYGGLSVWQLVDLSHAKDGPWHFVISQARDKMSLGLRIPDVVMAERFKYHKLIVGVPEHPSRNVIAEDMPFSAFKLPKGDSPEN